MKKLTRIAFGLLSGSMAVGCSNGIPTAPDPAFLEGPAAESPANVPVNALGPQRAMPSPTRTIRIVQGSVNVLGQFGPGFVSIRGTQGFVLDAATEGGIYPGDSCHIGCAPGSSVVAQGLWSSGDLPGTVKLQGKTFDVGGGLLPGAWVELSGTFVAPPQAARATVTMPFVFAGHVGELASPERRELEGAGTATLSLEWEEAFEGWIIRASRFEFRGGR